MKQYPQSVQATYEMMKTKLRDVVPDFELQIKAEIAYEINRLKVEKNAIILGHNYMEPALFPLHPRLCGRFVGTEPQGSPNRQADHCLLRCGIYGRDRQIAQPQQDCAVARCQGRLFTGIEHHRRRCTGAQGALSPACRW